MSVAIDGATINAATVSITASSTATPDSGYGVVVQATATVELNGSSSLTASGDVTLSATSTVGPLDFDEDYASIVIAFAATGSAPNCVNLALQTPATHLLVVRHQDRVGVLAGLLERLREANLNIQQMENIIFAGEEGAACARIQLEGTPSPALLQSLQADPAVFDAKLVALRG